MSLTESDRDRSGPDRPAQRTADGERTAVNCTLRPLRHGELVRVDRPGVEPVSAVVDRASYPSPALTVPGEDTILYLHLIDRGTLVYTTPYSRRPGYDHRATVRGVSA